MIAQILLTALVSGILIIVINLFRNRYLSRPLKWNFIRLIAYVFVILSSVGLTAMNPQWFNNFDGYICAVPLSIFTPSILESALLAVIEEIGSSSKLNKKTETS